MYGLLLEGIGYAIQCRYGEDVWAEVKERAATAKEFSTHQTYVETCFPSLAKALSEITGEPLDELMEMIGISFVNFVSMYGYDSILKVLGRNLRDFLNGLDNLHEYLRNSYPKMRTPSFFVENETVKGLTLHYRSKRMGYLHYVMGQIKQVGLLFYDTQVEVEVVKEEERNGQCHVVLQLHFDNKGFGERTLLRKGNNANLKGLTLKSEIYLKLFPFHILFGRDMKIKSIGSSLKYAMKDTVGKRLDFVFNLSRPPLGFTFENILSHTNSAFELTSVKVIGKRSMSDQESDLSDDSMESAVLHLRLKGQMKYLDSVDTFIFLATPIIDNLDRMFDLGLYINDLSMHDVSRDLVLIGIQQSKELKSALNQEKQKSKRLEEITRMVSDEIKKTDLLLYQMIPKQIADRIRSGDSTINTCQVYKEVTVLFSDIVNFNNICSQITPMQIVSMLNAYFSKLDRLTDKHKVYKVETVGATYMIVSGAPTKYKNHAVYIAEMSLSAMETIQDVTDPSCGDHLCLRIGIHSGPVVAGVVGLQVPRYCLFGDTVNTASRMQSNGDSMSIHITEVTKKLLEGHPYETIHRGKIEVKGKGEMDTFFLLRRTQEGQYHPPPSPKTGSVLSLSSSNLRNGSALGMYTPINSDHVLASQTSLAALTSIKGDAETLGDIDGKNGGSNQQPNHKLATTSSTLNGKAGLRKVKLGAMVDSECSSSTCVLL